MPVGTIKLVGFDDVEIQTSDGEYIGNLGEALLTVSTQAEDANTDTMDIQLVNRINKMNELLNEWTATFETTISNMSNALKSLIGIEDNNWRRMHGLKPRRRPLKERQRRKDV